MKCSIENCNDIAICKSYCSKHYRRWKKYGNPNTKHSMKGKSYEEIYGNNSNKIRKRHSIGMIGKLIGDKNPNWKGNDVGYYGIHLWVKKNKKRPKKCSHCKKNKKLVLANKSGKYKRDLKDWIYLCYKCHLKYDGITMKKSKCPICHKEVSRVRNICCSIKCKNIYQKR